MNFLNQISPILNLFSRKDRIKLSVVALVQIFLSLFDLIAVGIFSIIGLLTVTGIQSKSITGTVDNFLKFTNLSSMTYQNQVAILSIVAVAFFFLKTITSLILTKRTLIYLGERGASLSTGLIEKILSSDIASLNHFTRQELIFTFSTGIDVLTSRVIGSILVLVSDSALLGVLFFGLFIIDPFLSVSVFVAFFSIAFLVTQYLGRTAFKLGEKQTEAEITINNRLLNTINSYRESVVRNTRLNLIKDLSHLRYSMSSITSKQNFLPNLNKYIVESAVILITIMVSIIQFSTNEAIIAIANLAAFFAAATRIAPAMLRIQQGILQINNGLGVTKRTISILEYFERRFLDFSPNPVPDFNYKNFTPTISVKSVCYRYSPKSDYVLNDINLDISAGSSVAIVGMSGAGKTTLTDLILGVITPTNGVVKVGGLEPLDAFKKWPGACAYVPQDISIINGTILDNITFGYFDNIINCEELAFEALKLANLYEFVINLPEGLSTIVGERGFSLSGGQKQRLGIARAAFTKPKLLVLDEATNALDGETETYISEALESLKGKTTIIIIAHTLSVIENVDSVILLKDKQIKNLTDLKDLKDHLQQIDPRDPTTN
jgi:ABC-type multidrug transport system fused ATPase/permease subunit